MLVSSKIKRATTGRALVTKTCIVLNVEGGSAGVSTIRLISIVTIVQEGAGRGCLLVSLLLVTAR